MKKLGISKAWPILLLIATVFAWAYAFACGLSVAQDGFGGWVANQWVSYIGVIASSVLLVIPVVGAFAARKRGSRALQNLSVIFAVIFFVLIVFFYFFPTSYKIFTNFDWVKNAFQALTSGNLKAFKLESELRYVIPVCGSAAFLIFALIAMAFVGGKRRSVPGIVFGVIAVVAFVCSDVSFAYYVVTCVKTKQPIIDIIAVACHAMVPVVAAVGFLLVFIGKGKEKEETPEEVAA